MTEDDTFNALKRIPFKQLYAIWQDTPAGQDSASIVEQYGWTKAEFCNEYYKRVNDRS
jgi:hypothetical protein